VLGAQCQLVGCVSQGQSNGFFADTGADHTLFYACETFDGTSSGFVQNATGTILYVGCQVFTPTTYGFLLNAGSAHIHDCAIYGTISSYGVYAPGGNYHTIDGCRITNHGGHGIFAPSGAGSDFQITHNYLYSNGLAGPSSYYHIAPYGNRHFIHGNMTRDPGSGNIPAAWIYVDPAAVGVYSGHNDTFLQLGSDPSTASRRTSKLLLDYTSNIDNYSGGIAGGVNTWYDIPLATGTPNNLLQKFTVDSQSSLIEIACLGSILVGATTSGGTCLTRLLIDGDVASARKLGGENNEVGTYYQNALSGSMPFFVQGLAAGEHNVRLQVSSVYAAVVFLRASGVPSQECLQIQITEYSR